MTDTNIAPAPAAPVNEVPIDPNPVHVPAPLSNQAPEKPATERKGSEVPASRRDQTRESIKKAFDRSSIEAAKPKIGHNNPPETTKAEKPKAPPPIDLKRRPDDQVGHDARPRAEHGHFAAKSSQSDNQAPGRQEQAAQRNPLPPHAPYRNPPPRMDAKGAAEWHAAPESVRANVHRMHKEFAQAYQSLRPAAEAMAPIKHFHDLAQQQGTTLERALTNYKSIEDKLRVDPLGGLDTIVNNLNLRTPDGQRIGLRDIAWHIVNQSPEQLGAIQTRNQQAAHEAQLRQMQQRQAALEQDLQRRHYAEQFHRNRAGVDRFAETHPRLDELGAAIEREVKLGFDLPTAYARADRLYPATHAAQTRTAPAQTRTTDRSIHGAPASGSLNGAKRSKPSPNPRSAIERAISRVQGAL